MVKRVAKRGPNAGNEIWGCSKYPQCRGVVGI
jgi:restriction system protein